MTLPQRLLTALLAAVVLLTVLISAAIVLGVVLAVGIAAWAWLAWHSRGDRGTHVIEGEYRDVTHLEPPGRRGERPL